MNALELFGRCLVELIFCMIICSACLWVDFTNRYDIIERRKMLDNMSLFRKANMVFIKSEWFESRFLTKISYYTLRFSQMLFAAACIFFLCWNHTVHVWTVLENNSWITAQTARNLRNKCFVCRTRRINIIVGVIVRGEKNFLNQRKRKFNL